MGQPDHDIIRQCDEHTAGIDVGPKGIGHPPGVYERGGVLGIDECVIGVVNDVLAEAVDRVEISPLSLPDHNGTHR